MFQKQLRGTIRILDDCTFKVRAEERPGLLTTTVLPPGARLHAVKKPSVTLRRVAGEGPLR